MQIDGVLKLKESIFGKLHQVRYYQQNVSLN